MCVCERELECVCLFPCSLTASVSVGMVNAALHYIFRFVCVKFSKPCVIPASLTLRGAAVRLRGPFSKSVYLVMHWSDAFDNKNTLVLQTLMYIVSLLVPFTHSDAHQCMPLDRP
jgi:hypothetical protein